VAWEEAHGPIPEGMVVMHTCDNPPCYEVTHLVLGTMADNVRDSVAKGRYHRAGLPGESNGRAKLTAADVVAIRASADPPAVLAPMYGVHPDTIHSVRSGRTWSR
jgi:H2-forming N5,N10-methylenetetrahydromethanopterin dehydrogenase-like enzyme